MSSNYSSPKVFPNGRVLAALAALVVATVTAGVCAQPATAPEAVLVSNAHAKVTRAEYDAELLKLPANIRPGFGNSPRRVDDLLLRMLLQKSLAAQARSAGLDARPVNVTRAQLEVNRLLSQIYIENLEVDAGALFDANLAQYEARARELYLVDRAKYELPETITATHILFDTKSRDSAAAKALVTEARAKIVAGADMGSLAFELSDDPSAKNNRGKLEWFAAKEMDPAFAEAAFALSSPGELSVPVQSKFGWHVIRLDERRPVTMPPYEQVREVIIADIRKKYVDGRRDAAINTVRKDPKTEFNRVAVEALVTRVDTDAAVRALTSPATPAK